MKSIFQKQIQLQAPGGNLYEWKFAETRFRIPKNGLYAITITASAKNAEQNNSTDDDDLRVSLDGFHFGKYENHQEKISWKGFGTSASWDGASLKGGTKTIYYFLNLEEGEHILQFFADNTPILKSIEIFEIDNNNFELRNLKPPENIENKSKGIPWLSFVFLGAQTKTVHMGVNTKSGKTKGRTDGDNLKVVINGKIQKNIQAPTSRKYKNFYFSGDLNEFDRLTIRNEDSSTPLAFENAIELLYDEEPEISNLIISFFNNQEFLDSIKSMVDLRNYFSKLVYSLICYFEITGNYYSAQFLRQAMKRSMNTLIYNERDNLVKLIKKDPTYSKIINKIKEKIQKGILEGEIWPNDFDDNAINFDSFDLATALHGIKKVEYKAESKGNNLFETKFIIYDIYDFQKVKIPGFFDNPEQSIKSRIINEIDIGEAMQIIHNFEIEIHIINNIYVN